MRTLAIALMFAMPVAADELVFDLDPTTSCVAAQETSHAALLCVGRAANACMEFTPGGYSTVAMGGCFDREFQYRDGALNAAYQEALAEAKARDAENASYGGNAPSLEDALRDMQRAWIPYRDQLCGFERSKWGGGSGGGPAMAACLMSETARQTFLLRGGVGLQ